MSNQCKNCDRDQNNNYVGSHGAYFTANQNVQNNNRNIPTSYSNSTGGSAISSSNNNIKITAKVMYGSVKDIKDLREKEKAEKNKWSTGGWMFWREDSESL